MDRLSALREQMVAMVEALPHPQHCRPPPVLGSAGPRTTGRVIPVIEALVVRLRHRMHRPKLPCGC